VFAREPGFVCTVNTGSEPVALPVPGTPILASGPFDLAAGAAQTDHASVMLPPDTAVWWVRSAAD